MARAIRLGLLVAAATAAASTAGAVPVQAPISGEIQRIRLNDPSDPWSGGIIEVGGQEVIIPRNLLLDLPANRLTLKQLFDQAPPSCRALGETGLAKADLCNVSGMGGLAHIAATLTNGGNTIAGDVLIEKAAEIVTGRITYIDHTDGYLRINGALGDPSTGVMVRLNDPDGRHTVQRGLGCLAGVPNCSADPRFTLDSDNYTNVATTGYPICIPSTVPRTFVDLLDLDNDGDTAETLTAQAAADGTGDLLCPAANRTVNNGRPVADSRRFAPLRVGDPFSAEGNFEVVDGVRFLSAHSSTLTEALTTRNDPNQPDYVFLAEAFIDAPGFQNERARSLFIGFATLAPADVLLWSVHYDPGTNSVHEFPLGSVLGCELSAGAGECRAQGIGPQTGDIFRIRHDIDFIDGVDRARLSACAHLRADPRFSTLNICPNAGADGLGTLAENLGILSPIPREIQARTGHALANPGLIALDVKGERAPHGQYLFPFGLNLGGISTPEFEEIDLARINTPINFEGLPWLLDRRLSPGGCLDDEGNPGGSICETTLQPLDPFPYSGLDPRFQAAFPAGPYNDPNYTASPLTSARDRIVSYVSPILGIFNGQLTLLSPTPVDPAPIAIAPAPEPVLVCEAPALEAPVAVDDTATTSQGAGVAVAVLENDTGALAPPGTLVVASSPSNGAAAVNPNGTVSYLPAPGFSGEDAFTYTVEGPGGVSNAATVTVTVLPGAGAVVALSDLASTSQDTPVTIQVLANDVGSFTSPITVTIVTGPGFGTAAPNDDGTVTYTPEAGFAGTDSFIYTVLGSNPATVVVTVTADTPPPPPPPVAVNDSATVEANSTLVLDVLANDTGALSPPGTVVIGLVAHGTALVNLGGTVSFTPAPGYSGPAGFSYAVEGPGGVSNEAQVAITVVPPPPPPPAPVAVPDEATTDVGVPVTLAVLANDLGPVSPGTVTVFGATNGSAVANPNGTVTFTPATNYFGPAGFQYTVDGPGGVSNATTVSLTVSFVPETLVVTRNEYRPTGSEWFIEGTSTRPGATIRAQRGGSAGRTIGTTVVGADGRWSITAANSNAIPTEQGISTISSDGGAEPLRVRVVFIP